MKQFAHALCWVVLASAAWAQPQLEDTLAVRDAAERERIRQSRTLEQARFAAEDRQCYRRFAVNDCLDEVRKRKRALLGDLRRQEVLLNDAQRKRRGAEQLLRSDDRASRTP